LSLANKVTVITAQMQSFSLEKAQKCFSGRGSTQDPTGELTVLLRPLYLGFGEGRQGRAWRGGWRRVIREGRGKGSEGRTPAKNDKSTTHC